MTDSILTNFVSFQEVQPSAEQTEDGQVEIHTFSHMLYDVDVLDYNNHLSAG